MSEYAHNNFVLVSLKRSSHLQRQEMEDGSVVVWPENVRDPLLSKEEKRWVIPQGMRCPCVWHRMNLIQCEHEYNASKNVEKEKYNN